MRNPLSVFNNSPVSYSAYNGARQAFTSLFGGSARENQLAAMEASSTLFSIINKTSTATATVEWHMHRKRPRAQATCSICGEEGVQLVENHPALTVWNKPNNFFTTQEFVEAEQQHVDLTGEGWTVLGRAGNNVPVEMWNVRPDRIVVVTSPTKYILGYLYRSPGGEEVPLALEDVLSIRMPDPLNPYRGLGPVGTILPNIASSRYAAKWNENFFKNGAIPGGAIKLPENVTLQDDQYEQLQQRWAETHQGVSNAMRVAILEGGAEWADIKFSQKDMLFVDVQNLDKSSIREAFGAPKFLTGDVEDVNRATAEASKAWIAESMTVPRLDRWKGMLNNDFLPQFSGLTGYDPHLSMVYTSPVPANRDEDRADKQAKVLAFKTLVDTGVDPDVAAEIAGLPPIKMAPKPVQQPQPAPEAVPA